MKRRLTAAAVAAQCFKLEIAVRIYNIYIFYYRISAYTIIKTPPTRRRPEEHDPVHSLSAIHHYLVSSRFFFFVFFFFSHFVSKYTCMLCPMVCAVVSVQWMDRVYAAVYDARVCTYLSFSSFHRTTAIHMYNGRLPSAHTIRNVDAKMHSRASNMCYTFWIGKKYIFDFDVLITTTGADDDDDAHMERMQFPRHCESAKRKNINHWRTGRGTLELDVLKIGWVFDDFIGRRCSHTRQMVSQDRRIGRREQKKPNARFVRWARDEPKHQTKRRRKVGLSVLV